MNPSQLFSFLSPVTQKTKQSVSQSISRAGQYIQSMIDAIALATSLQNRTSEPSKSELATLEQFFGYGKAAKAFETSHPQHAALKQAFVDEQHYNIACKGVLHSYFTPTPIVEAMWRAVARLGVTEGRVIEPACGSGQYIKHAHPSFKGQFYGVELDPTVGIIARATNPNAKIYINQRFEQVALPNSGQFDLAISNPPWGNIKAHDKRFGNLSIHNYFALRSLSELRTGGIMALVVSSWLMDSKNSKTRSEIAAIANLVAAVRLPNDAFKSESVSLPTDILIFQKTDKQTIDADWLEVGELDNGATINNHFIQHPEKVIGDIEPCQALEFNSCKVTYNGGDLIDAINAILDAQTDRPIYTKPTASLNAAKCKVDIAPEQDISVHELFAQASCVYQRKADTIDMNGVSKPQYIEINFKNQGQEKRVLAYIKVKDALKALLLAEQANESLVTLNKLRQQLNATHEGFVKAFGPLSRTVNKSLFSQCSHYLRTKALEVNFTAENKKEGVQETFSKASILSNRVFTPLQPTTQADSLEQALAISYLEQGNVCFDRIASLMSISKDNAKELLIEHNMVYFDPESQTWQHATKYLSGDIRKKITIAQQNGDSELDRNIEALTHVLPEPLTADEITATLGALWIDATHYNQFANDLMGANADFTVTYQADKWLVRAGGHGYWAHMNSTWGTPERSFVDLLQSGMNGTPIKITYKSGDDTLVDHEATAEANAKLEEIVEEFSNWIWNNPKRRESLQNVYNETFNCFVAPDYSHIAKELVIDGCAMLPYDYQKSAITRCLFESNTLLDCAVGSGKSLIFQATAMLLKRMNGVSERIAIVMPNALVAQFTNSMLATFPSANIITLEAALSPEKREQILNTAMVSDFDLLILPESTFGALETPRQTECELISNEISELMASLSECEERYFNTKQIQKRIEKLEDTLEEITDKPRLNSVTWEDLNITTLMSDEIQIFKNLNYVTTYSNIRGMGTPSGSKKAWDFYVKARYIQAKQGRVIGGTGSSLSNSITEAITWMKVFGPELKQKGLHRMDAFIRQFSNPVTEYSLAATGRTLKVTTTLKRFQNLSELLAIYRSFAQVLSSETLETVLPNLDDGRPAIPPLRGGKIENVILPISDAQDAAFEKIVKDAQHISKENNMLKIIDTARKASLDIRHLDINAVNDNNVVNAICDSVLEIYNQTRHFKGTQVIFSDRSCPSRHKSAELKQCKELASKAEKGDFEAIKQLEQLGGVDQIELMLANAFSVYDEIEATLSQQGLKVAVVHDFKTDSQKSKLKESFNQGEYDVLLGSTSKLGTGWNINNKLVALHHADLPLRPGDFAQRNGRIRRQQNGAYMAKEINEVIIRTYSTERTLDSWFAALLDRKSQFIANFNNSTLDTREYDTSDEQIDFATLSALVSGDPALLELVQSQQELSRLSLLKRSHQRKVHRLDDDVRYHQDKIQSHTNRLTALVADQTNGTNLSLDDFTVGDTLSFDYKTLSSTISDIRSRQHRFAKGAIVELATSPSFTLIAKKGYLSDWDIYLEGETSHFVCSFTAYLKGSVSKILEAIIDKVGGMKHCYFTAVKAISRSKQQIDVANKELGKPFKHDVKMRELKDTIKELEKYLANEPEKAAA